MTLVSCNKNMTVVAAEEANELVRLHTRLPERARNASMHITCALTHTCIHTGMRLCNLETQT